MSIIWTYFSDGDLLIFFSHMFKPYIQNQAFLIPPSFREFLSEDHEAVILSDLIGSLDFDSLYSSYSNHVRGTSAYDPAMLFKVLIYAYSHKMFSSRTIALRLRSDIALMYLSGNQKPDFRTINRFRKEKGKLLESVFVQIVEVARDIGLISFGTLSLDGTKIYANASTERNETLASLEKTIRWLIADAEAIDTIEDEQFWDDDGRMIPKELKTKEGRDKKLRQLKEKREKAEKLKQEIQIRVESSKDWKAWPKMKQKALERAKINTTDPEARHMQMKRKDYANGYNAQILTENQIVLTSNISSSPADINELIPTLEKFKEQYQVNPEKLLADKWYASEENYMYLETNQINGYIPIQAEQVSLSDYRYQKEIDTYTDTQWNVFVFKSHVWSRDGEGKHKRGRKSKTYNTQQDHVNYKSTLYVCENHSSGKQKFISISPEWQRHIQIQKQKLETKEWKQIFSKRKHDVETVFARIKHLFWFTRFWLRWKQWASIEWNLITMSHNLKKIMNKIVQMPA